MVRFNTLLQGRCYQDSEEREIRQSCGTLVGSWKMRQLSRAVGRKSGSCGCEISQIWPIFFEINKKWTIHLEFYGRRQLGTNFEIPSPGVYFGMRQK